MKIQKSAEDYLETILILYNRRGTVHAIDIANELAFSKPSVSVAMKNLRENGYICVNENNEITLTESGRKIAETIYERHTLLSNWLVALGVDPRKMPAAWNMSSVQKASLRSSSMYRTTTKFPQKLKCKERKPC